MLRTNEKQLKLPEITTAATEWEKTQSIVYNICANICDSVYCFSIFFSSCTLYTLYTLPLCFVKFQQKGEKYPAHRTESDVVVMFSFCSSTISLSFCYFWMFYSSFLSFRAFFFPTLIEHCPKVTKNVVFISDILSE